MKKILGYLVILMVGHTLNAQSNTGEPIKDRKEAEKEERLRKKHESWDNCFIVKAKGDTIYGKVDHRKDQSTMLSSYISDNLIFFAHQSGKEEQFIPNNLKELFVINGAEGFQKYLVLEQKYYLSSYGILYRIIVDGPCKLVADRTKDSVHIQTSRMKSGEAVNLGSMWLPDEIAETHYYLYYKKKFIFFKLEISGRCPDIPSLKISAAFRKKCKKVFSECPVLAEQIENNTFRSDDIVEIVQEFNNCIGSKEK